jgi:cysteinyl-tRNA synthetase
VDGPPDPRVSVAVEAFMAALRDDFNTPRAMAEVFDLITEGNKRAVPGAHQALEDLLDVVGLRGLAGGEPELADPEARRLLAEREEARAAREFERADRIRERLGALGWEVRDTQAGPRLVKRG